MIYGTPKPPTWVQEEYFSEFSDFVTYQSNNERIKEQLQGEIDWPTLLNVSPKHDFWEKLEKLIYGKCFLREEFPLLGDYLRERERRSKEM